MLLQNIIALLFVIYFIHDFITVHSNITILWMYTILYMKNVENNKNDSVYGAESHANK